MTDHSPLSSTTEEGSDMIPSVMRDVLNKATCLFSKEQVDVALDEMATSLTDLVSESNPLILCVVIGGIVPLGNLLPRLHFPLEIDYIHATRYRNDLVGKDLQWLVTPRASLSGRTVVVVDDILDGGVTLAKIVEYCRAQGALEVLSVVLVDKNNARLPEGLQQADVAGLSVDNHYVFGYGMDYKGYLRNAPGIYRVAPEHE